MLLHQEEYVDLEGTLLEVRFWNDEVRIYKQITRGATNALIGQLLLTSDGTDLASLSCLFSHYRPPDIL